MSNNRVFWACQAALIIERNTKPAQDSISNAAYLTGVQSIGIEGDMPSNTLPDAGRFQQKFRYENREKSFTVNISRVLNKDDTPFYNAAYSGDYSTTHLLAEDNIGIQGEYNTNNKCLKNYDIFLVYGDDIVSNIGDSSAFKYVCYRGCIITSLSYNLTVNGLLTEDISLLCKRAEYDTSESLPEDVPSVSNSQSGNILKRQDIGFTLPQEANELFGTDSALSVDSQAVYGIQSISLELTIDYSNLNDVGIWRGYDNIADLNLWNFVNTPVGVSATFTGIARSIYPNKSIGETDREFNPNKTIKVTGNTGSSYFIWDLGTKNFLQSFSINGGDTGGGNTEISMTYANEYSDFIVAKNSTVYSINNNGPY